MVLRKIGAPLERTELADRSPGPGEVRVKVAACGVCRTDLHVVDGELPDPHVPIIPGHEIVGRIDAIGPGVDGLSVGERVGVPWLGRTCDVCPYCRSGRENLCDAPVFTGYTRDGGFATAAVADARFAFPLGEAGSDVALAPLLCAGLIGWRARPRRGRDHARAVRVRRGGPHRRASRAVAGAGGVRLHAAGRRPAPRPLPGASARPGRADRTSRRRSRSTPRSSSPRPAGSYRWH
nr:alcohol dehydrogenase catalytic domain-containing protein [Frigoriglobus tundricola]